MIYLRLILIAQSTTEASEITGRALQGAPEPVCGFSIHFNEPYWKIQGQYEVRCDLSTSRPTDRQAADRVLSFLADKWVWSEGGYDAVASVANIGSTFRVPELDFIWAFNDDLEPPADELAGEPDEQ